MSVRYLKLVFVMVFTTASLSAVAQSPLKLSGSVGYGQPLQSGVPGGFVLALEPKFIVNPKIDIGVLIEAAYMSRSIKSEGVTYSTNSRMWASYKATGNYWLSNTGRYQSFVGVGAGLYQLPETDGVSVIYNQSPSTILFPAGARFGGLIRYGVKAGHFIATAEYNLVLASTLYRSATPLKSSNSYPTIKVGYEIGGFKKKPVTK